MEGSNTELQGGERRDPDQTSAMEAASLAGTLPEEDRRAEDGAGIGQGDEPPNPNGPLLADELRRLEQWDETWMRILRAIAALGALFGIDTDTEWELADDHVLAEEFDPWRMLEQLTERMRTAPRAEPSALVIEAATLAAVHQFLATLSGPEATRAAALRAQLPAVPA